MKSNMLCAFLIAMLLVSAAAFGEILDLGPGASSEAEASASGSTNYDEDSHSGWYYEYTTTGGTFSWDYDLSAEAKAEALLKLDKWAEATAVAEAYVSGPDSNDVFVSASVSGTGEEDGEWIHDFPDLDTDDNDGMDQLDPYEGIYGDSVALAVAEIEEGSGCWAYAYAEAWADVNLEE